MKLANEGIFDPVMLILSLTLVHLKYACTFGYGVAACTTPGFVTEKVAERRLDK